MNITEEKTTAVPRPRFHIKDVTGARRWEVEAENHQDTVGDLLNGFLSRSRIKTTDSSGREVTFTLRGDDRAGGVRLHPSQNLSDLRDGDELVLQPSVQAGADAADSTEK